MQMPTDIKYDSILLTSFLVLLAISIVMVASASIAITEKYLVPDFYFMVNHLIYLSFSIIVGFLLTLVPIKYIEKFSIYSAFISLLLLVLVLVPGLSKLTNGAHRWIKIGPISVQVAEFIKLLVIIYMAGYLVRRKKNLRHKFIGVLIPVVVLLILDILLLLEPDFGTMVVISGVIMGLLFVAGIKLRYFVWLILLAGIVLFSLIISSSYRLERIIAFLHPWDNQFDKGYQLVQSLIAFGRGGFKGVGLGESVQKLLYLPEAYTDFIFAIIAEELGLLGAIIIILLYSLIIWRSLKIANIAFNLQQKFSAYLVYGISFWLALQTIINIGVNIGLLPTKGLTLPFISYGGSSLLSVCMGMAILFRVDFELKSKE